ncbi:MAG: hypothetical protein ACI9KF_000467 [Arenicella sp.]|jgi:hypothetical protein
MESNIKESVYKQAGKRVKEFGIFTIIYKYL